MKGKTSRNTGLRDFSNYFKNKTPRGFQNSFKLLKKNTSGLQDSFTFKKKSRNLRHSLRSLQNTSDPQTLSNHFRRTKQEESSRFFQITSKIHAGCAIFFSSYCKNTIQGVPKILINCSKKYAERFPKIHLNYFKDKTSRNAELRDSFKLL